MRPLLGVFPIYVGLAAILPPAIAADLCWNESQLRQSIEPEKILLDRYRQAYQPLPHGTPKPAASGFQPISGAIRRVSLPKGSQKLIALTFDLCEQAHERTIYQGSIIDTLRQNQVRATFFAGGKWMLNHNVRTGQLMADPLFEVANHAWEHRNFTVIEGTNLDDEIRGAQLAYERVRAKLVARQCLARNGRPVEQTAPRRMKLFRFPFGACSPEALQALADNGLKAIQWDVSSGDPDLKLSAQRMAKSVLARVKSGSIVLFHANGRGHKTPQALPQIIEKLRERGFRFVTVSELLAQKGAIPQVKPVCYDARPGDTKRHRELGIHLEKRANAFYRRFKVDPKNDDTASAPALKPSVNPSSIPHDPMAAPIP